MAKKTGRIIEKRELWHVEFRESANHPWKQIGTHVADAAAVLRIHDFRQENFPDTENQIIQTDVIVRKRDPELLRKLLEQKAAADGPVALQSE